MNKALLVLCIAIAAASLFGQATSQISGVITDPSNAAIVGAEVKATQTDTGVVERTVMSGADGRYVLAALPIGPYQIEVIKPGFKRYVQSGIVIQVASNPTVNVDLKLGTVIDAVTVEADATPIETNTTSFGTVMENRRITELALNGRNAQELMLTSAGAVPAGKTNTNGYPNGLNIAVAGGQLFGISYTLDGAMYNNLIDAVSLPFPFPDALQEFKVTTGTMMARDGTHASALVSASIKSGTNRFHGGVFEFLRNGSMNARSISAPRRDTLKRNQFGGTIGGPILKNRLFFFAGYQGTRIRSDPGNQTAFVPNAQMLSGDFSGCSSINLRNPSGGTFPGNQIPISSFSQQALNVVAFLPKPSGPCGQVSFGAITNSNDHQILGRIDYTINSKQRLYGRYMATKFEQPAPYTLSRNILDTITPGLDDLAQTAALGHTYVASPNVVNEFRFAANRVAVQRFNADYFSGCSLGVTMFCYFPRQTIIGVQSAFAIGANAGTPGTFFPTYLTLSDDVTVVRGSHTLAFGYSSFKYQQSQTVNITSVGNFSFTNSQNFGTGLSTADFLLGQVTSLTQSAPSNVYTNKWAHALYAQDTWKISRRLTLNYGLRWEPFLPQALNDGAVYNFSMEAFTAGIRSQTVVNAPPGLSYPGDPGFQGKTGVNKRWNQFAPRVGIAFDPVGNGMTSIRASGGIAYDFPNLQIMSNPTAAPPFSGRVQTNSVQFGNPYANIPNPFPAITGPNSSFPNFGTFVAQQPDAKAPTTYTWNLSVQHQLGKDWFVSASYLGSQSIHNWLSQALNPAILIPGPVTGPCAATATNCNGSLNINLRRLAYLTNPAANAGQKLGAVDRFESGGGSNYNGLILTTQKRLSRGVTVNVNYTWSHCIGDLTIGSYPGPSTGGGTYTDMNDRRRDRGNCSTTTIDGSQALDRRHIFNFTTVLESPKFQDRVLQRIASNWRLSSSYRFLSASYLSVTNGTDVALTGAADQRANRLSGDALCNPRGPDCWINPAAFAVAAAGTLGNLGRANVPGPGYFGIEMAVSRIFRLRESMSLEARGEAFNLTNSVRLNAPVTTRGSTATFGKILGAQDPRIMQVALKLLF